MNKERNSSFELLRIISMLAIIFIHISGHGQVNLHTSGVTLNIINYLLIFSATLVNTFVLITGYFQCEKNIKLKNIFKLNNAMWFYSVVICTIMFIFDLSVVHPITKLDLAQSYLPIQFGGYWFTKMYLVLYIISPFINCALNNSTQKRHFSYIVIGIILFSILPMCTNNLFYDNGRGFTIENFVLLYIIGAYLKKYPINKSRLLGVYSKSKINVILLFTAFFLLTFNFLLYKLGISLPAGGGILGYMHNVFSKFFTAYCNPFIIIGSTCIFLIFSQMNIKSKFINKIGGLMFGVYLIHEFTYLNDVLYSWFGFANINGVGYIVETNILVFIRIIIVDLIIFIGCTLIEFIRQFIFKFIYNRKISEKCRNKFYEYLKNF